MFYHTIESTTKYLRLLNNKTTSGTWGSKLINTLYIVLVWMAVFDTLNYTFTLNWCTESLNLFTGITYEYNLNK